MSDAPITVSRETLRAELGSLELRLVDRLRDALAGKADHEDIAALREEIKLLEKDKASAEDLRSVRQKIDSVNTRLVAFALTVAASAVGLAMTILLTSGSKP